MSEVKGEHASQIKDLRREEMRTPDEVQAMVRLQALGWGAKRIAAELDCARNTVWRWLRKGGWRPLATPSRSKKLDGLASWLAERFRRHAGNADLVRQELAADQRIVASLRTVERAMAPLCQELRAEARVTVHFETRPGPQLQIDFGERRVLIAGEARRASLFVATLGHSRRLAVRAFEGERQEHWFEGMESAFQRFGGTPHPTDGNAYSVPWRLIGEQVGVTVGSDGVRTAPAANRGRPRGRHDLRRAARRSDPLDGPRDGQGG